MTRSRTAATRALPLDMVWQRGRWPEHTAAHAAKLESAGKVCKVSTGMQRGVPPELAHMPCQWVFPIEDETNPLCRPTCPQKAYWMTGISDLARTRFYCYKHGLRIWKRMEKYKKPGARRVGGKIEAASGGLQPPAAPGSEIGTGEHINEQGKT